jgi:SagB-type dehydrogenase family enzyme
VTREAPTVDVARRIHGADVGLDDPAETFHEASRLAPSTVAAQMAGSVRLASDPLLQVAAARSSRRHPHRPRIALERARLPRTSLRSAIDGRASALEAGVRLRRRDVAVLLGAAYAVRRRDGRPRRGAPSAGALYPLELYPVVHDVGGIDAGVYHYDPFDHALELLRPGDPGDALADAVVDAPLARAAAVAVVVTAMLPRVRFKYGQRGYRFALLEAGHLAQTLLLAATALRLTAMPYGGFYDRRLDDVVGADGLDEVSAYVVFVGGRR